MSSGQWNALCLKSLYVAPPRAQSVIEDMSVFAVYAWMWLAGSTAYRTPYTAGICSDQKSWMSWIDALRVLSYDCAAGRLAAAVPTPTTLAVTMSAPHASSANHLVNTGTPPLPKAATVCQIGTGLGPVRCLVYWSHG